MLFLLQTQAEQVRSDWDKVQDWLLDEGLTILGIFIFVMVAIAIMDAIVPRAVRVTTQRRLADKPQEEIDQRAETLTHVFTRTGSAVLSMLGFFTALPELGINIAPLLAGVGVVGVAVGFGAQSLVRDVIAGLFILLDNQYGKGDVVRIADISGMVEDIGIRRTVLRDLDGVVHYVPNGEIKVASNFTQEFSRVNFNISVSYSEDLDRVIEVINEVGKEMAEDPVWKDVVLVPPRVLRIDSFGESGIDVKIVGDVQPIRQWDVMGELRLRLKKAFDREGIEIPFPHRVMVQTAKAAGAIARQPEVRAQPEPEPEDSDADGE